MILASTKERLLQYIEAKGISKPVFYAETGIKRGLLDADKLKSTVSDIFIAKIFAVYPDLSLEWLITGKGEMLNNLATARPGEIVNHQPQAPTVTEQQIPIYEIQAADSLEALLSNRYQANRYISLSNLPVCDGAVYMRGDRMAPELKSSDILIYKKVKNLRKGLIFGEIYLLSLNFEGEEYVAVQRIKPGEKSDHITLVNANTQYPPQDIHRDTITAAAIIKASVRYNMMGY